MLGCKYTFYLANRTRTGCMSFGATEKKSQYHFMGLNPSKPFLDIFRDPLELRWFDSTCHVIFIIRISLEPRRIRLVCAEDHRHSGPPRLASIGWHTLLLYDLVKLAKHIPQILYNSLLGSILMWKIKKDNKLKMCSINAHLYAKDLQTNRMVSYSVQSVYLKVLNVQQAYTSALLAQEKLLLDASSWMALPET